MNGYERERRLQSQLARLDAQVSDLTAQAGRLRDQVDATLAAWNEETALLRVEVEAAQRRITAALEALRG